MLLTAELPVMADKCSNVHRSRPPQARKTPGMDREKSASPVSRGQRQRASKTGRVPQASTLKKQKPEINEVKVEKQTEVRLKSTVVDIDSVREEANEEHLGLLEATEQEDIVKHKSLGVCEWLLLILVLTLVLLFLPLSIWFCFKVVREHERAVIFRLGHLLQNRPRGPGLLFYLPLLDVCHKVDIRLKMLTVPSHTAVTKDLVRLELSAVCYYQIENMALCCSALSSLNAILQHRVQAAVKDILSKHTFSHILHHRRWIGQQIQAAVDSDACRWGVRVERTDIDDLSFPAELHQSTADEAEATKQQQAKAAAGDGAALETFRSCLRLLHPALLLPFPADLRSLPYDLSSLPPPPPSAVGEEGTITEGEPETDSHMM